MSELGTVHVLIAGGERVYPGVPVSDDGVTLAVRAAETGPTTMITGHQDWRWRVDVDQLPGWARESAEKFADRVRRP